MRNKLQMQRRVGSLVERYQQAQQNRIARGLEPIRPGRLMAQLLIKEEQRKAVHHAV